ncbi:hypothetical protein B0H10DRAFT_2094182 [Mycena sp. CBHHK59/15]|nr:hypothetical protein B0H10DRAFT_2094182 [Mycena sp. CBHHK59/15]
MVSSAYLRDPTNSAGGRVRWVRSGCFLNAELRPFMYAGGAKAEMTPFGIFATRALEKGEEVVLGWGMLVSFNRDLKTLMHFFKTFSTHFDQVRTS